MALLLVTTLSAFSQTKNITVSGRVVEDTKEPAIQATVQLLLLPDSVQASGTATTAQGYFTLPKVSAGKYVLKVSYIGFKSQYIPLHLYATTTAKNVGTLTLETDAVMLAEAVVTAEAPQVQVVEDTLMYNSTAYRTPEGAMLEELVKKLPGAEAARLQTKGKKMRTSKIQALWQQNSLTERKVQATRAVHTNLPCCGTGRASASASAVCHPSSPTSARTGRTSPPSTAIQTTTGGLW